MSEKTVDCPECGGTGEQLEARLYPNGHTEVWVPCEVCDGIGNFPEDTFLMMKLAGEI